MPGKLLVEFPANRIFVHFVQGQERLMAHGIKDCHGSIKLLSGERRDIQDRKRL